MRPSGSGLALGLGRVAPDVERPGNVQAGREGLLLDAPRGGFADQEQQQEVLGAAGDPVGLIAARGAGRSIRKDRAGLTLMPLAAQEPPAGTAGGGFVAAWAPAGKERERGAGRAAAGTGRGPESSQGKRNRSSV